MVDNVTKQSTDKPQSP